MCRYAFSGPYKQHGVCFACRKAFKVPPIEDYLAVLGLGYVYQQLRLISGNAEVLENREGELGHRLADLEAKYRESRHKCPTCSEPMADMGLDFKAPPQSDGKAWKILADLYRVGHAFHTCGCHGPGWIPKSTADYRVYLETQKIRYYEQLESVRRSSVVSAEAKGETVGFWMNRIQAIDAEIKVIGG